MAQIPDADRSALQRRCMVRNVFAHEAGNEVIAVVVSRPEIERQRVIRLVARIAQ